MEIKLRPRPPSYIELENTRINGSFYTREKSWNFNTPERHLEH